MMKKHIHKKISSAKEKGAEFERAVREKTLGYIVASFGLVAGLAWNEAVKAFIEEFFPMKNDTLKAKFIYAVIITSIVVFVSLYIVKIFSAEKKECEPEALENKKSQSK